MKITEQTTLAELSAYLESIGNPFVTLMKAPVGVNERHAIIYVAGHGTFHGGGQTEAQALDDAFASMRRVTELQDRALARFRGQPADRSNEVGENALARFRAPPVIPASFIDDVEEGLHKPAAERAAVSLAEQTQRLMEGLTPKEREILAKRFPAQEREILAKPFPAQPMPGRQCFGCGATGVELRPANNGVMVCESCYAEAG